MYKAGEYVIYATYGVCKITDIVVRTVCGNDVQYYRLQPVYEKSVTLFVPMNNSKIVSKMKKVMSAEEIDSLIKGIPAQKDIWIENESQQIEN